MKFSYSLCIKFVIKLPLKSHDSHHYLTRTGTNMNLTILVPCKHKFIMRGFIFIDKSILEWYSNTYSFHNYVYWDKNLYYLEYKLILEDILWLEYYQIHRHFIQ